MEGIINLIKPPGITSHDAVSYLRKVFSIKRIGHGGTLDPGACGVIPIFIGKATRAIEYFENCDKEYIAEITLGKTYDTGDNFGNLIDEKDPSKITLEDFRNVISKYIGEIEQIPPMYSAIKVKGRKLYEYARKGLEIERKPRKIYIYTIKILDFKNPRARIKIHCSKGTYIRTLCEDIGKDLGCGAHMSLLIRTRSGPFSLEKSVTFEEIEKYYRTNEINGFLLPVDKMLNRIMKKVTIPYEKEQILKRNFIPLEKLLKDFRESNEDFYMLYDKNNVFFGIGKLDSDRKIIKFHKIFI
ncbi:tRNA pseudouridine(55) synthase TruB [Thermovenabulum sp.]|uniref:tRNA pseudouridine(55) synthase TruB n=1 Tax=Thermovenabulum sp. TaxID=3100335 RepID=UPI003C7C18C3